MLLNEKQLDKQFNDIVSFLSAVHPTLADGSDRKACIEIRPVTRGTYDYKLSRSFCLWEFTENTLFLLRNFLEAHNGAGYCLYYSVFNFDYQKESFTKAGKRAQKGRITAGTARYVNEIAIDFDDVTNEQAIEYMQALENIGINPLWTYSGHGYHAHILLDEALWDTSVLFQMVYLLRSRGFMADTHCIDAARVFRLPGTYNYKGFNEDKNREFPLCRVIKESTERYSIEEIVDAISSLPITSEADNDIYIKAAERKQDKPTEKDEKGTVAMRNAIEYPELVQSCLPNAVIKMLTQCEEGYRNAVCGFLIKYFKQYYKLSREDIYSVLSRWADEVCEPPFDLDECFDRFYNAGGLNYDAELAAKYGIIDFAEIRDRSIIWIPNEFCNNFDTLSAQAVKMYLAIKQLEHHKKPTTLEAIMEVLDMSHKPTARNTIKELIANKFAYVVTGNKKTGEQNTYFTQKLVSYAQGHTRFSYNDIAAYVRDLNGGEVSLYMYMKYKCFRTGGCFMAQKTLGEAIGQTPQSVGKIVRRLAEKSYVEIQKNEINEFISYCDYTLLR